MSALPARLETSSHKGMALPLGLVAASFMLFAGGNLAGNGVVDPTPYWSALPGWEQGSLARLMLVSLARWGGGLIAPEAGLALLHAGLLALALAALYQGLCRSNWPPLMAAGLVLLLSLNGPLVFAVTWSQPELPLVLALGAVILAHRQLEARGSVQAVINYALTLPLLLIAGPAVAMLLPMLFLAVPLREPEARRSGFVFVSLLLVALVPSLIVLAGVTAAALRAGLPADFLLAPIGRLLTLRLPDLAETAPLLLSGSLVALVVPLHLVIPDRRRQVFTSLLVLLLPAWLLVANLGLDLFLSPVTPALALLATTAGWLAGTRLNSAMRWLTLGLMGLGTGLSWLTIAAWSTPDWRAGLLPIHLFGLSF